MDLLAHALWAGARVTWASRRWPMPTRNAVPTVVLAVAPDVPHMLPVTGWALFSAGQAATLEAYATALPGHEPVMPPWVEFMAHHLHCITHSAIIAGILALLMWAWTQRLWIPLLG